MLQLLLLKRIIIISIFWCMTKKKVLTRIKNADLTEKMDSYNYKKINYLL